MKPCGTYGTIRRDNLSCPYGCCHGDRVRGHGHSDYAPSERIRRVSKRRARQEIKKQIDEALDAA